MLSVFVMSYTFSMIASCLSYTGLQQALSGFTEYVVCWCLDYCHRITDLLMAVDEHFVFIGSADQSGTESSCWTDSVYAPAWPSIKA